MAQTVNTPVEINPATYIAMFEERMPAPKVISGVCGRVVRGTSEADFAMLAFANGRRLAWVMGPDGLRDMIGRSVESVILGVGKDRTWLSEKVAEAMRWRLVVLPQAKCVRADWLGVFAMIEAHYPEVAGKFLQWSAAVQDPTLAANIDPTLVTGAVKDDTTHPCHMNVERYLTCKNTAANARLFLWHSLGLNQHFVGDGWATDPKTKQRAEEYLTANVSLARVQGCRWTDLIVGE